jgi:hypothetical protein
MPDHNQIVTTGCLILCGEGIEFASMEALRDRLARYRRINLGLIGRTSGKTISTPVWFVLEADKLYLLPDAEPNLVINSLINPGDIGRVLPCFKSSPAFLTSESFW